MTRVDLLVRNSCYQFRALYLFIYLLPVYRSVWTSLHVLFCCVALKHWILHRCFCCLRTKAIIPRYSDLEFHPSSCKHITAQPSCMYSLSLLRMHLICLSALCKYKGKEQQSGTFSLSVFFLTTTIIDVMSSVQRFHWRTNLYLIWLCARPYASTLSKKIPRLSLHI